MRNLREILRLRLHAELNMRQIKDSLRVSLGAVQKVVSKANELGLDWGAIEKLDEQQLASIIYPASDTRASSRLELPGWVEVYQEFKGKGVTKNLLWEEYYIVPSLERGNHRNVCSLLREKWVEYRYAGRPKMPYVSGNHCQTMFKSRCSDH